MNWTDMNNLGNIYDLVIWNLFRGIRLWKFNEFMVMVLITYSLVQCFWFHWWFHITLPLFFDKKYAIVINYLFILLSYSRILKCWRFVILYLIIFYQHNTHVPSRDYNPRKWDNNLSKRFCGCSCSISVHFYNIFELFLR